MKSKPKRGSISHAIEATRRMEKDPQGERDKAYYNRRRVLRRLGAPKGVRVQKGDVGYDVKHDGKQVDWERDKDTARGTALTYLRKRTRK